MSQHGGQLRQYDYVDHMIEAVRLIDSYLENVSYDTFRSDRKTQQAVIFNLLVIGEAATKIGNEYAEWARKHPEIPWRSMRGMRNRLAHGYFEIDLKIVWETVQTAIKGLEADLARVAQERPPP
jgi:uncharacterized protein with HEPN domain